MDEKVELILGPPGTGKTTRLLNVIEKCLKQGIDPGRIGFISFTKKAVEEAAQRAVAKFNLPRRDFNYFRTIHSLSFHQLGMSTAEVLQPHHYKDIGKQIGMSMTGSHRQDMNAFELGIGDQGIFIDSLAKLTCRSLHDTWNDFGSDINWLEVNYISDAINQYKEAHLLWDYADMLVNFFNDGVPPTLDILFIDEAQDLCLLQWKIIDRLIQSTKRIIIAGDDDQAIFKWSGAAVDYFIGLVKKIDNTTILNKSYRLPKSIKTFADDLIRQVSDRKEKIFTPTDKEGSVEHLNSIEHLTFEKGNWLILVRNNFLVKGVIDHLRYLGLVYKSPYGDVRRSHGIIAALAWERIRKGEIIISKKERDCINKYLKKDLPQNLENISAERVNKFWYEILAIPSDEKEYYKAARRMGESFVKEPRVVVSTIHGAKGSECENVVVLTDMSAKTYKAYMGDQDSEVRVYYVAVTRALKHLKIIQPETNNYIML